MKAIWSSLFSGLLFVFFLQSCQTGPAIPLTGLWEIRFESDAFEGRWINFSKDQTFELGQWDTQTTSGRWQLSKSNILELENFSLDDASNERAEWIIQLESGQREKLTLQRTNPKVGRGKSNLYLTRIQHQPTKS
ncbi:MAG: hypothetical protein AAFV80_11170 [Bacteroidota bacterium]